MLCSDNRTYEVKEAETSNSLLVIPNLEFPDEIKLRSNSDMLIDHKNVSCNSNVHTSEFFKFYLLLIFSISSNFMTGSRCFPYLFRIKSV